MDKENPENSGQSESSVVDFPVHKVTLSKVEDAQDSGRGEKVSFQLEQRKVLVSASFFSIVLAVSIANFGLDRGASGLEQRGRGIASISPEAEARNQRWQDELVKDLAEAKVRPNAQRGISPSEFEKLNFGELQGRYAIQLNDNQIQSIERAVESDQSRAVASAFDGKSFLNSYASLFPKFDDVVESKSSDQSRKKLSLYRGGQKQADVDIRLATNGELLSLTVEK